MSILFYYNLVYGKPAFRKIVVIFRTVIEFSCAKNEELFTFDWYHKPWLHTFSYYAQHLSIIALDLSGLTLLM